MLNKIRNVFYNHPDSRGITLIEILVTSSIIVFMTVLMLRNFSTSRLNLERVANVFVSDIRLAQQLALSSHQYKAPSDPVARNRCGYGITNKPNDNGDPNNNRKYSIYAGPPTLDASGQPVSCGSTIFQQSQDFPYYKSVVLDPRLDFVTNPRFRDVFYAPPGPTTYIQNSSTPLDPNDPTTYYEVITIKRVGVTKQQCAAGSADCISICVYYSGRVEVSKTLTCPAPF